jgi:hypothetical protein
MPLSQSSGFGGMNKIGTSITDRHEARIRELAGRGCTDPEIARAVGVSESAIWQARRRLGIAPRPRGGRHRPVLAVAPVLIAAMESPDERFARAMAGRRFESLALKPARRLALPRPDPADGLGVSSAWSAMQLGDSQ